MKTFKTNLSYLSKHYFLRNDVKFLNYKININKNKKYILLKNIFNVINGNSYTEYYTEEKTKIPFIRVGDLSFKDNIQEQDLIYLNEDVKIPNEKILKENDLILATIGTIGKTNLITKKFIGGTFSNNTVLLRLKRNDNNPIFIEKLFKSSYIQDIINNIKSQKAQPNLQTYDLLNIKIPQIPLEAQNKATEQITPIENKIQELKAQIQDPKTIINEVFAEEFNFNINEFEEIKKIEKINKINFSNFSKNKDLRNSVKFNKKSYEYLINFLKLNNFKILKDIVEEPIVLGAGINQNDIDTDSNYYYISMAELKNFKLDISNCKKIKKDFFNSKIDKSIKYGDIIIARSGEGTIGKCAIINIEDIEGINADFTIKVRINEKKYNRNFAYLYFCSFYFQYMVEINKKGLGNNTNIFPTQIQNFLIPNIPLQKQQEIVNKIQTKINEQNKINDLIEKERDKINYIIENIVNS